MSFNCLVLNTSTLIPIFISKDNNEKFVKLGQQQFPLKFFKVVIIREYICEIKNVIDVDNIKLWKTNVKLSVIKDQNISTEEDVKNKLEGKELKLNSMFIRYFKEELNQIDGQDEDYEFVENIHIIATINFANGK